MKLRTHERLPATGESDRLWQTLLEEAQDKPWLLRLLGQRGAALYLRFRAAYARWGQLRPGQLRRLQRKLGLGLAGAALLLALAGSPAHAATITVGGACTLAAAITNANSDNQSGSTNCAAGSGTDTIILQTDVSLTSALPNITSPITIARQRPHHQPQRVVWHLARDLDRQPHPEQRHHQRRYGHPRRRHLCL